MIFVVATLKVKRGLVDQVIAAAEPNIRATRAEPGNIAYALHQSVEDPDTLVLFERWETRDHWTAHFSTPHMAIYRNATSALLESRTVEILQSDTIEVL